MSTCQPQVLLIDDNLSIRSLLRTALELNGYEILEAENGRQALQHCKIDTIDVAITDMHMPEMNGEELIRVLHHDFPHLHIIAMSADQHRLDLADALGITYRLKKPFELEELNTAVQHLLQA